LYAGGLSIDFDTSLGMPAEYGREVASSFQRTTAHLTLLADLVSGDLEVDVSESFVH
jgi:hypothetical protein